MLSVANSQVGDEKVFHVLTPPCHQSDSTRVTRGSPEEGGQGGRDAEWPSPRSVKVKVAARQ